MDLDFYDDITITVRRKQWKSIIHKNVSINYLCVTVCSTFMQSVYILLHASGFDPPPPSYNFLSTLIQRRPRWENIGHDPFKYIEIYTFAIHMN